MTDEEKEACHTLLKFENKNNGFNSDGNGCSKSVNNDILARVKQRHEANLVHSPDYINCNFIYGSAAEVECLWSIAKHILEEDRRKMDPVMFEVLLLLKVNKRFWGIQELMEADRMGEQYHDNDEESDNDGDSDE